MTYRYKIENTPEWVNDSAVKSAFPFLKNTVKEKTVGMVLANNGWEVR